MKKLTGHIITGLQKCEERNIIYRAYVLKEHGKDIDILDQEHLDDWIKDGGNIEIFSVGKEEVISDDGPYFLNLFDMLKRLNREMKS